MPTTSRELTLFRPGSSMGTTPAQVIRGPKRLGLLVIVLFLLVFAAWAGVAPLAGGAIAPGKIAPYGSVRTVQHLEGGIIREIFVKEGDYVARGAPLIGLEKVASQADVDVLLDRRRARIAEAARLTAELAGRTEIAFPRELGARALDIVEAERRIFEMRLKMRSAQKRVLQQRTSQLSEQIRGFDAQVASAETQLGYIRQEIGDKTKLLTQGLAPKAEVSRLQRAAAEIEGFRGEYLASIAEARQRIGETEIELVALEAEWLQEASQRASEVRGELAELNQQLAALRDVLDRTTIRAPISGVIGNLRTRTVGGVIVAGQDILDLVPTEERLVIDVRVSPIDIDIVKVGLPALVRLTTLSGRNSPRLHGHVTLVSPNVLYDESVGTSYYGAKVEVNLNEIGEVSSKLIVVGMPAEVILIQEERTVIEYIIRPLYDAMSRAGREA